MNLFHCWSKQMLILTFRIRYEVLVYKDAKNEGGLSSPPYLRYVCVYLTSSTRIKYKAIYWHTQDGDSALMMAVSEGVVEVVSLLLESDANTNLQNKVAISIFKAKVYDNVFPHKYREVTQL